MIMASQYLVMDAMNFALPLKFVAMASLSALRVVMMGTLYMEMVVIACVF